jgi:hypothetical protein
MSEGKVPGSLFASRRHSAHKVAKGGALLQCQVGSGVSKVYMGDYIVERPPLELRGVLPLLLTDSVEEGEKGLAFLPKVYGLL